MPRKSTHETADEIAATTIEYEGSGRAPEFIKRPKLRAHLIELAGQGNFLYVVAQAAGIKDETLKNWLTKGRKYYGLQARDDHTTTPREQHYIDFFLEFTSAEAEAERVLVDHWHDLSINSDDHKPTESFLARRYPERWGKRPRENTPAARQVVVHLTAETMEAAKKAVADWEQETFTDEDVDL